MQEKEELRILQVFDFLSLPHGGGTVDIVYRLSKALSARGHTVTICTGNYELDQEYIDALDIVDVRIRRSWINRHGAYIMPSLVRFEARAYDIIHLHCYRSFQNAVICRKALRYGVPYVIDAHGSTVDTPGWKQLVRVAYDLLFGKDSLKHASRVIAETEIGVAEYKKLGTDAEKIRLLHPLLSITEFSPLPETGLFRNSYCIGSRFIILFVGRVHQAKGIETLVYATRQLVKSGHDVCLAVVGQDDGFMSTLTRLAVSENIADRVLFTGFLTGKSKLSAMVDADVLVQPSKNEAGARPSLEALLCGTPVIVTRNTGAGREIAKIGGGLLFDYGDTDSLVDALLRTFADLDATRERTELARAYIKANLSLNKQITDYEKMYYEMINEMII